VPIAVKGGIKSRSKRGAFTTNWWARRWIAVLEALNLGGRLQRGRRYARKGQVLDIAIEPGAVRAEVQGSRPKPYTIGIGVAQLGGGRAEVDLNVDPTRRPAPLVHLLGNLPFWRGEQALAESLEPAYARAAVAAVELLSS